MTQKKKLAIITTHPIQYNAPWFQLLHQSNIVQPKVFYTWSQVQQENKFDPGFNKIVQWDIPLLDGYDYCFVQNISSKPGTHHFNGINNPGLIDEIEQWQADAVLVFGWAFQSHRKCIRHFHGKKKVFLRGDSTLLDDNGGLKSYIRKYFLRWVYSHIDYALYVGTNNKKYFLNNGVSETQLVFVPHAVDNARFENESADYYSRALELKKRLGLKEEDVVLLFAGKFEPKKDPFFLIEIAKRIPDSRLKILFVGNGMMEVSLKKAAKNDARIIFMDFQNQQLMPVIYRVADLFVLPSAGPGETWGLALNEAMACGLAVVASSKTGGAADLIKQQVNGIVFKANDTTDLEKLLYQSLENKDVLKKMGRQSKEIVQQFSYKKNIEKINSLIAGL